MEKPRTERLLDLLKKYPDGLSQGQLIKMLKVKKGCRDIGNTLQLLKKNGHKIVNHNGNYTLYEGKALPPKEAAATDKLTDVLSKYPEGITLNELSKKLNRTKNAICNQVFFARKKGHNIVFRNNKYLLLSDNILNTVNRQSQPTNIQERSSIKNINAKNIIPKQYHDAFLNLSDANKRDCVDMLFKSSYYYKSAIGLLETNKELHEYITSLEGGV